MPTTKSYTDGAYGQIHVRQTGFPSEMPALFCLHQSPKSSLEFEDFMLEASKDRLIVGADYPGYGMSDRPPSEDDATVKMYADEMWKVADALDLRVVDLFGNHTGSKVAIEMARQQPERVRGIAMVSAAILTDEERAQFSSFFEPIPLDREGTRIIENWKRIVASAGEDWPLEKMDRSFLQTCMGGEAYEWGHAAAFSYTTPFTDGLRELPHRKLLLNPADSLQECTRRAEGIMTNGTIVECPEWTFGFLDMHPEEIMTMIRDQFDGA
ncbi:MAG: alpha/beta fold hydrolase [Pseudomonadota bacterium]